MPPDQTPDDTASPEPAAPVSGEGAVRQWKARLKGVRRVGRWLGRGLLALLLLTVLLVAVLWWQRERVAGNYLDDLLAQNGIRATYEIEQISPQRQVLRNVVVGDPAAPDMVIDRAEVTLVARLGLPQTDRITLSGVRLWGRVVNGQPSFGALDPLIFTDSTEPFALPEIDLRLVDARALIEGDYGPIAVKLDGGGFIPDGFRAQVAAIAPRPAAGGCTGGQTTLYGTLQVANGRPGFAGPVRFAGLACPSMGLSLGSGGAELDFIADADLSGVEGEVDGVAAALTAPGVTAPAVTARGRLTFRAGNLDSRLAVTGRAVEAGGVRLANADFAGTLRSADGFTRLELDGDFGGNGLRMGPALDDQLARAVAASQGTLAQPLLARVRGELARQLLNGALAGHLTMRREGSGVSLVIPEARLTNGDGASLVQVARTRVDFGDGGVPRFSGNFLTGGPGLPQISGRMHRQGGGGLDLQMAMAPYAAGDASLAVPRMAVTQASSGALTFAGDLRASGAIPNGFVRDLAAPVSGTVSAAGAVSVWHACTPLGFGALGYNGLVMVRQQVTLCPPRGRSILSYDAGGLRVAAGAPALRLTGRLGDSALRLSTGAIGLAYPGAVAASDVDLTLGVANLAMERFTGTLGETITGQFTGGRARLGEVPLAIGEAAGILRYADGVLALSDTGFTLSDRQAEARFYPLRADGATLTMSGNRVTGAFALRHPASGAEVSQVALEHDLASGRGHADLLVTGLTFRDGFQPADLTINLYGPVSDVRGTVTGRGRVDWSGAGVTSSTGTFNTEGLDLAAAFGPVQQARGTVVFSDLIGLTTAPGQRLTVGSINPGIEVLDGELAFSLTGGTMLQLQDATWPFMGGTIRMRPVAINIGATEERSYIIDITGLEAQRFVEHMGLSNISATGTFDGSLPIVFDGEGNGLLQGGTLLSRPPGGRVSYIGELTYEDLTPIANYAFDALRDMEYDTMAVTMNGSLAGELVTSIQFDGVRQGPAAEQNFITRRLANLPIRFVVNVRAPFYSLVGSLRSLYDPSAVRDPRSLGLLTDDGTRFVPGGPLMNPAPANPTIQPPESEALP